MSFEGPAATSAMPSGATTPTSCARSTRASPSTAKAGTSSAYNYYNGSWGLMTLMLMTGNMTPF